MNSRKYNPDDIQRILKSAAEYQRRDHDVRTNDSGLSLKELEHIAAEAGIDARYVRMAARDVSQQSAQRSFSRLYGGVSDLKITRHIPSSQSSLDSDELKEKLVPVIRDASGKNGTYEHLGQTLTWKDYTPASYRSKIVVEQTPGDTIITGELSSQVKTAAYAGMALPFILFVTALGAVADNALGPAAVIFVAFIFALFFARFLVSSWTNSLDEQLQGIVDSVERAIIGGDAELDHDGAPQSWTVTESEERDPLLDLDGLEESEQDAKNLQQRDRSR